MLECIGGGGGVLGERKRQHYYCPIPRRLFSADNVRTDLFRGNTALIEKLRSGPGRGRFRLCQSDNKQL